MIRRIVAITILVLGVTVILKAQDDNEFIEPYTQTDLSVLIGNVLRPNGIIWHDNNLYAVCNGDWTLYEIEDTVGDTRTYIYGVRDAHTLLVEERDDNRLDLWVPDYDVNALLLVNQSGAPREIATELEGPWGIAYYDEGSFLVTNLLGNNIAVVNRNGEWEVAIEGLRSPTGIVTTDNYVFVANNGSSRRSIEWIDKDMVEDESPELQPLVSGLQNTTGLVLAEDGYLYFAYALGTRGIVGRVDPTVCQENGGCSNDQVEIVLYTELPAPLAGLTISPDMRLFVHTIYRPEIYWLQLENTEDNSVR